MKKLGVLVALIFVVQIGFAQYDPEAKVVLDAMSDKYQKVSAFTAVFKQKLTNESAGLEEIIDGTIQVKDQMYKLEIAGQQIFNDGTDIWAYNPDGKEVTVSANDPEEQEISLSNIWDLYKSGFKYILMANNDNGNQVVDLDPLDRSKSYYKIRMFIKQNYDLHSFLVFESSGNKYHYAITEFSENNDLTDSDFKFDPSKYPGVEVIDFRD
ncbi:MAG: outer membrane lipoprotein carrier protein LolA [Cyclobacteriaceae bacterium]